MKQTYFSITICLLLLISFIPHVSAEVPLDGYENDSFINAVVKGQEKADEFQEANSSEEYLNREWTKILETTQGGRIILSISGFLTFLSPLFQYMLGMPYTLSWAFLGAVFIWLAFFFLLEDPLTAIFRNKLAAALGAFAIASIIGSTGVIKGAVDLLGTFIDTWWITLIIMAVLVIIAMLSKRFGKTIRKAIEKAKENSAKERVEKDRKILQIDAETSSKKLESYRKGMDYLSQFNPEKD